jgi:hypothetical protein
MGYNSDCTTVTGLPCVDVLTIWITRLEAHLKRFSVPVPNQISVMKISKYLNCILVTHAYTYVQTLFSYCTAVRFPSLN